MFTISPSPKARECPLSSNVSSVEPQCPEPSTYTRVKGRRGGSVMSGARRALDRQCVTPTREVEPGQLGQPFVGRRVLQRQLVEHGDLLRGLAGRQLRGPRRLAALEV